MQPDQSFKIERGAQRDLLSIVYERLNAAASVVDKLADSMLTSFAKSSLLWPPRSPRSQASRGLGNGPAWPAAAREISGVTANTMADSQAKQYDRRALLG